MPNTTDPIADMLSRLRNAIAVRKTEVTLPHSNIKQAVAQLLQQTGFVLDVVTEGTGKDKMLRIIINNLNENSRITEIVRLSTPGRRWYASADDIPPVKRGRGVVIISTSKGLMTGDQAKKQRVGGELVCKVY